MSTTHTIRDIIRTRALAEVHSYRATPATTNPDHGQMTAKNETHARIFAELDDPRSEVSQATRTRALAEVNQSRMGAPVPTMHEASAAIDKTGGH